MYDKWLDLFFILLESACTPCWFEFPSKQWRPGILKSAICKSGVLLEAHLVGVDSVSAAIGCQSCRICFYVYADKVWANWDLGGVGWRRGFLPNQEHSHLAEAYECLLWSPVGGSPFHCFSLWWPTSSRWTDSCRGLFSLTQWPWHNHLVPEVAFQDWGRGLTYLEHNLCPPLPSI